MPYIYTKRDGSQLKVSDEQLEKLKSNPTFDASRLSRDDSQITNEAKKIIASNDDRQDTSERASRPDATQIHSLAEDQMGLGEALATAGKLPFRVLFPSTVRSAEESGNNDITLNSLLSGVAEFAADFVPAGRIASAPLRVGARALAGGIGGGAAEALGGRNPYEGAAGGVAGSVLGDAAGGGIKLLKKATSREAAQGLSNTILRNQQTKLPDEELLAWSLADKGEREYIRSQARQRANIGQEMVDLANNPITSEEAETVSDILPALGYLDLRKPISSMQHSKLPLYAPGSEKTNAIIDKQIENLKQWGQQRATRENRRIMLQKGEHPLDNWWEVPAADYRSIRTALDEVPEWGVGTWNNAVENAFKNGRTAMKNELLDAADAAAEQYGIAGYSEAMRRWSDKLDAADDLRTILGAGGVDAQSRRSERVATSLAGPNRSWDKEAVKRFDDAFGTDLFKRAQAANTAEHLNVGWRPAATASGEAGEEFFPNPRIMSRDNPNFTAFSTLSMLRFPRVVTSEISALGKYQRSGIPGAIGNVADKALLSIPAVRSMERNEWLPEPRRNDMERRLSEQENRWNEILRTMMEGR